MTEHDEATKALKELQEKAAKAEKAGKTVAGEEAVSHLAGILDKISEQIKRGEILGISVSYVGFRSTASFTAGIDDAYADLLRQMDKASATLRGQVMSKAN